MKSGRLGGWVTEISQNLRVFLKAVLQIPFALDNNPRATFVQADRADMALVSGLAGADKRFGTLQVASHGDPDLKQPGIGGSFNEHA